MGSDEIDLRVYLQVIKKRIWWIVVFVLVCTILAAFYSYSNYVPLYQASTKLIVNDASEPDPFGGQIVSLGIGGANSGLIDTYKEIIRTPVIMDKVVQRFPHLGVSAEYLMAIVNVAALNNTQVMVISVTDVSHERAVMIVNAITEVFRSEIPSISKVSSVVVLNDAKLRSRPQPINEQQNAYVVLAVLASLIVSVGFALLLDSMDDTMRSEADIQAALGVPMLASVPKLKPNRRRKLKKEGGDSPYASLRL